ncbi:hypothetical protein FT662_01620 [Candidozyma haemuli var. vulneris]|nr:hypothetical protein FT662_01620 [[Candida] haemuloni var. vulneris]
MIPKHVDPGPRSDSLKSTVEDRSLENVDLNKLYESVLKVLLLEYICEARFYQPIRTSPSPSKKGSADRRSRFSRLEADCALPSYLIEDLKVKLNGVAMKKSNYDDLTRRSLLRLYGEMLAPSFKNDVKRANNVGILVMKFVSAANKEVLKVGSIPNEEISTRVFQQTDEFIKIIASLIQRDKNRDALLAKLEEHKAALKPAPKSDADSKTAENVQYLEPSCQVSDMDRASVNLVMELFNKDQGQIQSDILRLKPTVTQKTLHKDVDQALFYLGKDIGKCSPKHFTSHEAYDQWKEREHGFCQQLYKKYSVPSSMKLLPNPPLPAGSEFYIMPSSAMVTNYYTILAKLCLLHHKQKTSNPNSMLLEEDVSLLSNKSKEILQACGRVWRIDYPTRAIGLFSAAHLAGILIDPLFQKNTKELGPIDLEMSKKVLCTCKQYVGSHGKLDWEDKLSWSTKDQEQWSKYLGYTYSEVLYGIKDCLSIIMSKTVKPKFGPYLAFLGDFVESDVLFDQLQASGAPKKWERKLTRTLLRVSEASYAEVLRTLPRDDSLSIMHIIDISEALIENIKTLQKRYKNPLLGFLNVSRTYAAVVTGMFASDAKNILKHIAANTKAKGEFLNYGDALEAYKTLKEIRSIHGQVSPSNAVFSFKLEDFFYPHLEAWVAESSNKIRDFVLKAIEEDSFEPIDIENDQKKYSTSVHDIFTLIKYYLSILKSLEWQNRFQVAKVYTLLMKSISNCALLYSSRMSEMIMEDLNEEVLEKTPDVPETNGWFAEVKSKVASYNLNNSKVEVEEPFNFTSRTCIGLNNIDALITHLGKLEELLNPEEVSQVMAKHDPSSGRSYTNHIISLRVVKAEELRSSSDKSSIRPYLTLVDTKARKTLVKTRSLDGENPEWDEEAELTLAANSSLTMSATVWEEKMGTHSVCGRALMQLEPRKFKHDGIPQEIFLDLDPQGRVQIEIAVESERDDAIFAMGRAHRALKRSVERITKLIVAKFSKFIKLCFSRNSLKSVCGASGNVKPSQEQMDDAMLPLYNYLNMNLSVLAQFLTRDLLHKVMLEAWNIVVASADELLLPKLASAKALRLAQLKKLKSGGSSGNLMASGWQSAVSSAMANVTNSMSVLGFGKTLTNNEIETVIAWLHFLCLDFFHNEGNGPAVYDLKTEQYQSILLIPVYYDKESGFLIHEVERLSPAYLQMLRDKNNVFISNHPDADTASLRSRAGSIARSSTIRANATAQARARAAKEARELSSDPLVAQTSAENIILRLLLIKDEKAFVAKRVEQRERLAHTIATERLARAAAEGTLFR